MSQLKEKQNNWPTIYPYSDEFSISCLSEKDLEISYSEKVAAKTSNRKPNLGEQVLILAKKENGVFIFPAEITGEIETNDPKCDVWYDRGGNRWKHNYSIRPLRQTTYLSNEEVADITGCALNESRKVWVDQMTGPKWGGFRQKILNHLLS